MLMKLKELLFVGALIYTVVGISPRKSRIKLENNVYSGLLIGVSEKVLPSQTFIDGIEVPLYFCCENKSYSIVNCYNLSLFRKLSLCCLNLSSMQLRGVLFLDKSPSHCRLLGIISI